MSRPKPPAPPTIPDHIDIDTLINAIEGNRVDPVREALDAGFPVDAAMTKGRYPYNGNALSSAIYFGSTDVVKLLLERGANPNQIQPGKKISESCIAINQLINDQLGTNNLGKDHLKAHWEIFNLLLRAGLKTSEVRDIHTLPLFVSLMFLSGVTDDVLDNMAKTPLATLKAAIYEGVAGNQAFYVADKFAVLEKRHFERLHDMGVLEFIFSRGQLFIPDELIRRGRMDAVDYLVDVGLFDPEQADHVGNVAAIRYIIWIASNLSSRDRPDWPTVKRTIDWFKSRNVNFDVRDEDGCCLSFIIRQNAPEDLAAKLQSEYPDIFGSKIDFNSVRFSSIARYINQCFTRGDLEKIVATINVLPQPLLDRLDFHCMEGQSILNYAAQQNAVPVCEALVRRGFDPNRQDRMLELPLHVAARAGAVEAMLTLYFLGADPLRKDAFHGKNLLELVKPPRGRKGAKMAAALQAIKSRMVLQSSMAKSTAAAAPVL